MRTVINWVIMVNPKSIYYQMGKNGNFFGILGADLTEREIEKVWKSGFYCKNSCNKIPVLKVIESHISSKVKESLLDDCPICRRNKKIETVLKG